jgi:hypothetical protein
MDWELMLLLVTVSLAVSVAVLIAFCTDRFDAANKGAATTTLDPGAIGAIRDERIDSVATTVGAVTEPLAVKEPEGTATSATNATSFVSGSMPIASDAVSCHSDLVK